MTWKPMGYKIGCTLEKLMEDSTERIGTMHTLLLTILKEKVADCRGHGICTDPSLINQSS